MGVARGSRAKCAGFTAVYTLETMMKIVEFVNQQVMYTSLGCVENAGGKWWEKLRLC